MLIEEKIALAIACITILCAWLAIDSQRPFIRVVALIALSWATIAGAIYIMEIAR